MIKYDEEKSWYETGKVFKKDMHSFKEVLFQAALDKPCSLKELVDRNCQDCAIAYQDNMNCTYQVSVKRH